MIATAVVTKMADSLLVLRLIDQHLQWLGSAATRILIVDLLVARERPQHVLRIWFVGIEHNNLC